MSQINIITSSLSEAMLHSLWQGLLIALLLGLVLKLLEFASAHQRYLVIAVSMGLQLLLIVGTFYWIYFSTEKLPITTDKATTVLPYQVIDNQMANTDTGFLIFIDSLVNPVLQFVHENHLLICLVWLLGAFVLSFRFAGGLLMLNNLRKRHNNASAYWMERLQVLSSRMGIKQKVELVTSSEISVPSLIGWIKPVIILPVAMLSQMSPVEIESILVHELAHVKRHDYLIHVLQSIIEILLFFNPFTWWLSNLMNTERENCCDDIAINVLGDYKVYIQALATLTNQVVHTNTGVASGILAATGKKGSVIFRIKRIMKQVNKKQSQNRYTTQNFTGKITAYFALLLFASTILIGTGQAQEKGVNNTFVIESVTDSLKVVSELHDNKKKSTIVFLEADSLLLSKKKDGSISYKLKGEEAVNARVIVVDSINLIDGKLHEKTHNIIIHNAATVEEIETIEAVPKLPELITEKIEIRSNLTQDTTKGKASITINSGKNNFVHDNGKQPLYIINGEKVDKEKIVELLPESIATIDVIKGEKAISLYGDEAKNGVVSIILKDDGSRKIEFKLAGPNQDNLLYFLNDEPISRKKFKRIKPEDLSRIDVIKGEAAIKIYGKKAANGVLNAYTQDFNLKDKAQKEENKTKDFLPNEDFANGIKVFPNPSNELFKIQFTLLQKAYVKVLVNDITGKQIAEVTDGEMEIGYHELNWRAKDLSKGIYFINIEKDGEVFQRKVVLE